MRNPDDRLRSLERRVAMTGDPEDYSAYAIEFNRTFPDRDRWVVSRLGDLFLMGPDLEQLAFFGSPHQVFDVGDIYSPHLPDDHKTINLLTDPYAMRPRQSPRDSNTLILIKLRELAELQGHPALIFGSGLNYGSPGTDKYLYRADDPGVVYGKGQVIKYFPVSLAGLTALKEELSHIDIMMYGLRPDVIRKSILLFVFK